MTTDDRSEADHDSIRGRLRDELPPPAALEDQVVARLGRAGLLRGGPRQRLARDLVAAAAIFIAGVAAGAYGWSSLGPRTPEGDTRFLLLLYAGAQASPTAEADRIAREYGDWAAEVRRAGRSIAGERLAAQPERVLETGPSPSDARLQGFFVIGAESLEDAERVAGRSPHLKYGGRIVIRRIDTP